MLHRLVIQSSRASHGIRDLGALESAITQPRMTFGGQELYPSVLKKATALGFSLIQNHPFLDGNKRVGHAAIETFLILNGLEIEAAVDEQERVILTVATGELDRSGLLDWLRERVVAR